MKNDLNPKKVSIYNYSPNNIQITLKQSETMKTRPKAKVSKMALIGTQRVGKTSLLTKFHFGTFDKNTIATVGASFILHQFKINGEEVSFQIWDTAGQERYRSLAPIYYRDASCAIAVFDLSAPDSFEKMNTECIRKHYGLFCRFK